MSDENCNYGEETPTSSLTKRPETGLAVNAKIVMPAVSTPEAVKAWGDYQEMKKALAEESDMQKMGDKIFLKKSYWRKIQRFFNLQLALVKEERIIKPAISGKENIAYSVVYRAEAPNRAFADGDGFCESWEKNRFNVEHNVRATAHTRAKNRAISDLVGGGEVSAEEVSEDVHRPEVIPPASKPATGGTLTEIITVESVAIKDGVSKKTGKPWKQYTIYTVPDIGGNKQHFNTFSESFAAIAKNSIGKNQVSVSYTVGQYGNDLKAIDEIIPEPELKHEKDVEDIGF